MKKIPRIRFAHLPTPVESLPRISAKLGGPRLYIKRDDQTGLAFGGNKTRKLEFLIPEAQAHGAETLITTGAVQSNHCRQTAAAAAKYGFKCILVLAGEPQSKEVGNYLIDSLLGAEVVWTDLQNRDAILKDTFDRAWKEGKRPYLIPYGGSNPTGATAYSVAISELIEQLKSIPEIPVPDWIVFASSSGGTQAGMVLGGQIFGFQGIILGISVDEPEDRLRQTVFKLTKETASLLNETYQFKPQDILVNADYLGDGYGVMGDQEKEAIHLFAKDEGILLDPVYTGRAAAGLIDLIHQGFFNPSDAVLFWHTGGTPALFADQYNDVINLDSKGSTLKP